MEENSLATLFCILREMLNSGVVFLVSPFNMSLLYCKEEGMS